MIVTCTACNKKFVVPDNAIPPAGRVVQCSSCSNEWRQFPVQESAKSEKNQFKQAKSTITKSKKSKGPVPYSKEYMQQKWGTSIKSYAAEKGLSKKVDKSVKQYQKRKKVKEVEKPSFGFFNYIIVTFVFSTFFIGILNFERTRLSRKFPFLEPYINHFFETLNNFKIFILDFYR